MTHTPHRTEPPSSPQQAGRSHRFEKSWGAELLDDGRCRFRLWAPQQQALTLRLEGHDHAMTRAEDGWFEIVTDAAAGDTYHFILEDGLAVPDPAARAQAGDQHGPSLILDPLTYVWERAWKGRPWHETVIYELHIGTFAPEGTYRAAIAHLPELVELGITMIEIMPVAHFPGNRNWGYDGVLAYAPHNDYGTPDDMKAFIDAAHGLGLSVVLDVVYNHFGPDGNYLSAYAPQFFCDDRHTPWGVAIDYTQPAVRAFFIENALYWLEEFQLDGLRFDAIDNIEDDSPGEHLLEEMARRIRARFPGRHIHLTTEDVRNITALHERDGEGRVLLYDAEWNDDFHHAAHVIATGEDGGYYGNYTDDAYGKIARALAEGYIYQGETPPTGDTGPVGESSAHLPPVAFVNFIQNHDQIGNRAFGERLTALAAPRMVEVLTSVLLLSPQIPLIYMGEEYGETAPFHFFTDVHGDLGESIRKGRREEAGRFGGLMKGRTADEIPDPLSEETRAGSRLDREKRNTPEGQARLSFVANLLALRHAHVVPLIRNAGPDTGRILKAATGCVAVDWALEGKRLQVRVNFTGEPQPVPPVLGAVIHSWPQTAGRMLESEGKLSAISVVFALE